MVLRAFNFIQRLGRKWSAEYDSSPHPRAAYRSRGRCVVTGGFGIYYRLPRSSRYGFSNINKRSSRSVFRVMERSFHTLLAAASGGNFDVVITLWATIIPDSDYSTVVFHVNLIKLLSRRIDVDPVQKLCWRSIRNSS